MHKVDIGPARAGQKRSNRYPQSTFIIDNILPIDGQTKQIDKKSPGTDVGEDEDSTV